MRGRLVLLPSLVVAVIFPSGVARSEAGAFYSSDCKGMAGPEDLQIEVPAASLAADFMLEGMQVSLALSSDDIGTTGDRGVTRVEVDADGQSLSLDTNEQCGVTIGSSTTDDWMIRVAPQAADAQALANGETSYPIDLAIHLSGTLSVDGTGADPQEVSTNAQAIVTLIAVEVIDAAPASASLRAAAADFQSVLAFTRFVTLQPIGVVQSDGLSPNVSTNGTMATATFDEQLDAILDLIPDRLYRIFLALDINVVSIASMVLSGGPFDAPGHIQSNFTRTLTYDLTSGDPTVIVYPVALPEPEGESAMALALLTLGVLARWRAPSRRRGAVPSRSGG